MGLTRVQGSVKPDKIFNTIAEAKAVENAAVGDVIQTIGYTSANDGGGALYRVVAAATGTDDGGSYHDMTNVSGQLELISKEQLDVRVFGVLGSGTETAQLQAALDFSNNVLIPKGLTVTSAKITLASNQKLTIDGTLKAVASIGTELISGTSLTNVTITGSGDIDGNKANQPSGDNYCIKITSLTDSLIENIRVHDCKLTTVPGNEGAIYGISCTNVKVVNVESDSNDATGILFETSTRCGSVRCHSHDNTASGIIFTKGEKCYSHNDHVHDNSFSNLNLSGKYSTMINPLSYNSGFSGLNFGESTDPLNHSDDSVCIGGVSYDNTLDGISIQSSDRVKVIGLTCFGNVRHNARVFSNSGKTDWIGVTMRDSGGTTSNGLFIESGSGHFIGGGSEFYNNDLYGINLSSTASKVTIDESVKCYNNGQTTSANSAGLFLASTVDNCIIGGEYYDTQTGVETQEAGVWNGGGDGHVYNGFYAHDNKTYQLRETSGPTNTNKIKVKLGNDPHHGSWTASASTTDTITNSNAQDVKKISIMPGNAAAVTLGQPFVNTFSSGVSFTVTYPATAAGTEVYYYEIE